METGNVFGINQDPSLMGAMNQTKVEKDDFLKLLITQLSHQDPMSPMESEDFATQLAQFSSLEQLRNIDANIEHGVEMDLILTQAINNTLAATIIGKDAKAVGNEVVFNADESADVTFRLDGFADDVEVAITDSAGNVVRTLKARSLGTGEHSLNWDGKNEDGRTIPEGQYNFSVEATTAGGNPVSAIPLITGTVSGVRYENGMAVLMIEGKEVSFSSVLEIGMNTND